MFFVYNSGIFTYCKISRDHPRSKFLIRSLKLIPTTPDDRQLPRTVLMINILFLNMTLDGALTQQIIITWQTDNLLGPKLCRRARLSR